MEPGRPSRAIVFIPESSYEQSADRCLDYVKECGYEFKGIVRDWATVWDMFNRDEVTVAIVADPRDLDPRRKPRVEYVSHKPNAGGKYWDERTRIIRRDAAT